jgi:membrane associated rhomboid family serine protease
MLIPVAHENLRGRRWPYVSIVLIALNFFIFLFTIGTMRDDMQKSGEVQLHILLLSAHYPEATPTSDAFQLVESFKREHPGVFEQLAAPNREVLDGWDARQLGSNWSESQADAEMARLCAEFDDIHDHSFTWNFAFHPYHPKPWSYITANFLHWGWLHIIFNMWFLWLAGTILEDAWGRVVYPIFYLVSGAGALLVHGVVFSGSMVPVAGASTAIAGLMGGFLARFPKTKIKLMWIWFFGLGRYKFFVPAYVLLPLWLVIQLVWGLLSGSAGGVAYWAHVGGFAFGMVGAVVLRATGIERAMDQAIEAKVSWTPEPRLAHATELLLEGQSDAAIGELQLELAENPDSGEALELLLKAQEKLQDFNGMKETLANLCRHCVTSGELGEARTYYEQYVNLGGERLPRGVWLELCRHYEKQEEWDRAATEYEKLGRANPTERVAVPSLVSAARINLTKLSRVEKAERLFKAAEASTAPHLDSDQAIQEGLKQCAAAIPKMGVYGTQ